MAARRKAKKYCIAFGCLNSDRDPELSFFTLPVDVEKHRKWLELLHREDLLAKKDLISKSYFVCAAHFENSAFKKGLRYDSLPIKVSPDNPGEGLNLAAIKSRSKFELISNIETQKANTVSIETQTDSVELSEMATQTIEDATPSQSLITQNSRKRKLSEVPEDESST